MVPEPSKLIETLRGATERECEAEINRLIRDVQRETAEAVVAAYESHMFTPRDDDNDNCQICDHNFRHGIHLRCGEWRILRVANTLKRFGLEEPQ